MFKRPSAVFNYFELAVLDSDGLAAFKRWLDLGGNFIGIHSASDSLNHTDFFVAELGTSFDYHPPLQQAVRSLSTTHYVISNVR